MSTATNHPSLRPTRTTDQPQPGTRFASTHDAAKPPGRSADDLVGFPPLRLGQATNQEASVSATPSCFTLQSTRGTAEVWPSSIVSSSGCITGMEKRRLTDGSP